MVCVMNWGSTKATAPQTQGPEGLYSIAPQVYACTLQRVIETVVGERRGHSVKTCSSAADAPMQQQVVPFPNFYPTALDASLLSSPGSVAVKHNASQAEDAMGQALSSKFAIKIVNRIGDATTGIMCACRQDRMQWTPSGSAVQPIARCLGRRWKGQSAMTLLLGRSSMASAPTSTRGRKASARQCPARGSKPTTISRNRSVSVTSIVRVVGRRGARTNDPRPSAPSVVGA